MNRHDHFSPDTLSRIACHAVTRLSETGALTIASFAKMLADGGCAFAEQKASLVLPVLVEAGHATERDGVYLLPGVGEA